MNRGSLLSAVLLGILALSGEALSSRAATQTVLVPTNAVWRFSDTGSDLGTWWKERDYDDRSWASGPAELGYGDAGDGRPEATLVSYGPDPNNKFTTTYFRHWFSANNVELA